MGRQRGVNGGQRGGGMLPGGIRQEIVSEAGQRRDLSPGGMGGVQVPGKVGLGAAGPAAPRPGCDGEQAPFFLAREDQDVAAPRENRPDKRHALDQARPRYSGRFQVRLPGADGGNHQARISAALFAGQRVPPEDADDALPAAPTPFPAECFDARVRPQRCPLTARVQGDLQGQPLDARHGSFHDQRGPHQAIGPQAGGACPCLGSGQDLMHRQRLVEAQGIGQGQSRPQPGLR